MSEEEGTVVAVPQECRNCFCIEWETIKAGEDRKQKEEQYLCDMCTANPEMVHRKKARLEKILMGMEETYGQRLPKIMNLMYEVLMEEIEECKN